MILAFDLGSNCGYAVFETNGKLVTQGLLDLNQNNHQGGGWRFLLFERKLKTLIETYKPIAISYELVRRHVGTEAAHIYGGLLAVLQKVCEETNVPYNGRDVKAIKKSFTGNGNASKELVCETANKQYGLKLVAKNDDDIADAIAIGNTFLIELQNISKV